MPPVAVRIGHEQNLTIDRMRVRVGIGANAGQEVAAGSGDRAISVRTVAVGVCESIS
jgi:hypothetical protein